ncbi:MAG TPA: Calx-beta domain-containing protein [Verrucomicrobiae bacterium]
MKKAHLNLATLLLALLCAANLHAQVEGPSGHYYQVVLQPGILWDQARDAAQATTFNGVHGHLAAITSAEEDQFIETLRQQAAPGGYGSVWVGGWQDEFAPTTHEWHWINGEGPIPMNGGEGYSNWHTGEPNDYQGQPENYLTVGHFNQFGWNDDVNGTHVQGYVVEFPSGGTQATVGIRTLDYIAVESNTTRPPDPAVFEIFRSGNLTLDLPVFYSIHGSAQNGIDYNEIARSIVIPAGQTSVQLTIAPRPDALTVVEPLETVGIRLEPSPILTPQASYEINSADREAAAVIYEERPPQESTIDIAVPRAGATYQSGEVVKILTAVYSTQQVFHVRIYAGEIDLGTATRVAGQGPLHIYEFWWNPPGAGSPDLNARALINQTVVVSKSVRIIIQQTPETSVVSIRFVDQPIPAVAPNSDYTYGHLEVSRIGPTTTNLQVFYSVDGTATAGADYETLQGYVVLPAGKTNARVNVVVIDDLIDEPTESVIVSLIPFGATTDPATNNRANYVIDMEHRTATQPIFDNDPPADVPVISISASPREIEEPPGFTGPTVSRITLTRTGSLAEAQRVDLQYTGTATRGVDYSNALFNITFPAGSSNVSYNISALSDGIFEGTEYAVIGIGQRNSQDPDPANRPYAIDTARSSVRITILDEQDDPTPIVSISLISPSTQEPSPNMDVAPAIFALQRTGPTNTPLTVFIGYTGTASNGVDYPSQTPWVNFAPGQRERRVEVHAIDDSLSEGTENIVVSVKPPPSGVPTEGPSLYTVDTNAHTVVLNIFDNDIANGPFVTIEAPDPIATELPFGSLAPLDSARFLFTRHQDDLNRDLRVFYSIHGTAKNGEDYQTLPGSVVIPAGQGSAWVEINPITDDTQDNRHHYEFVSAPGITWHQARAQAENTTYNGIKGHLATITSAEEDQYIETLRQQSGIGVLWVGAYQEDSEPSVTEGWKWLNNEGGIPGTNGSSSSYSNWGTGEPNDYWGVASENHLVIGWAQGGGWNDQRIDASQGYVVEFDLPIDHPGRAERMETVALRLEPSPLAGPLPSYTFNEEHCTAVAVIFEHQPPTNGAIEVAFPSAGHIYHDVSDVDFFVAAYHPTIEIEFIHYSLNGERVGTSNLNPDDNEDPAGGLEIHRFHWSDARSGTWVLKARTELPNDVDLESSSIPFQVIPTGNQPPVVTLARPSDGAVFMTGDPIEVVAEASDPEGAQMRMILLVDNTPVFETNSTRLAYVVRNLTVGAHTFEVRATDNAGGHGSDSANILVRHPDTVSFVQRHLPAGYSPGVSFEVQLRANPPQGTHAYAVEDRPPQGWTVSNISHEGVFDSATGKVKFGPFIDSNGRFLTYRVTPPNNATGRYQFIGSSSANSATYPITGDEFIHSVQQHHPADTNQSFTIVLQEVTAYAASWKAGQSWPTGPVPIPVSYVTRAGRIWRAGEAYIFDRSQPAPACWIPSSEAGLQRAFAISKAGRSINGELQPGTGTFVQIAVSPAPGTSCYALEEKPPRGWAVGNISHSGTYDATTGTIRWGAFMDATPRTLTYAVIPPAGVTTLGTFLGELSCDGLNIEVGYANSGVAEGPGSIEITAVAQSSAGLTLDITGPAGQTALVESTTDFKTWTTLRSIFLPDGGVEFTDTTATDGNPRFYRLRVQ